MGVSGMDGSVAARVTALTAAVDDLLRSPMDSLTDTEVLDTMRAVETARRRLECFDQHVVAALDSRAIPERLVMRNAAAVLSGVLNLSPAEAGRRVRHARELGVRLSPSGQALASLCPATAEHRTAGRITDEHASVILRTLHKLPACLPVEEAAEAERFLADWATKIDARQLTGVAHRLLNTLDPDGSLTDERDQARRRNVTVTPLGDGMHRISGELDAECSALASAVLGSLSAPQPTDAGGRDERTPGQRRHDAFRSVLKLALRSGELPKSGGTPATVLITMTADQLESRTGVASTSFGQPLSVDCALRLADQAAIAWIVHNSNGKPLALGRTRRLATEHQTLALIARDGGCAFPGCQAPPEWTEKHHVIPWADGGQTDVDGMCLLCDYHHDRHERQQWTIDMHAGIPWFIPPEWIDPERKPLRNSRFSAAP